ncbi:sensor histidine kinase [Catellatospora sp. KI3]|uniref:sensor histidine kinase n=1 Tax=Catellatospora sp. KI3 TaxID=3041620 RepID=UPI00248309FE|nr:sensor histidine kinase [Catellatospora sp. KI3]MDI1462905.1 sensor histidine kinase [Catellatospora sp. KI3]
MSRRESWSTTLRTWDLYFAIAYVVVLVLVVADQGIGTARGAVAAGALTAMAVLYACWGRPLVACDADSGRVWPFIGALLVLQIAAIAAVPVTAYIDFALSPLMFMSLPLGQAIAGATVANLMPLALALGRRADGADLHTTAIMSVFGVSLSVLMGVFIIRVLNQSQERLKLIGELEASRGEVARLSREAGVAAERSRLAGEIHDTLAQGFTSIVTLLQAVGAELERDPVRAREHVDLAVRTARENLAESRALIAALQPAALDAGSLEQAVRRQAERLAEEIGVEVSYAVGGQPYPLPTAVEVVLLRAAQEALANVRRHAGAAVVLVRLDYRAEGVALSVQDDGRGFDAERDAQGFGLPGMRARAAQVSGVLTVDTEPGRGTAVTLEVPS